MIDNSKPDAAAIYNAPFMELLYRAQTVHRSHFEPSTIQCSKLLSIKTGGCPEDCSYCSQSARYDSELSASKMMEVQKVLNEARKAKAAGATRYCMGAAWRSPKERDMPGVLAMVRGVKAMGLETCMTLGMLSDDQAAQLREAGLDYYNHNIDTSERYYSEVITSRTFADRLDTLDRVRAAGINVCSGGIVGMGETADDRIDMLRTLAEMQEPPESVPINMLMPMKGTPMADMAPLDPIEMVRTIATARILMPRAYVRLSAGRSEMSDELQAMCFFAGANSIFVGDTLLTADNPGEDKDALLFNKLNLRAEAVEAAPACPKPAVEQTQERAA
ncbi:biotin synthase BioB [Brevundimonas sp.]|uniref:biotin synthase BioB n=1 Tax=Brevundimonas sp. TaxID=1871086 RepID=UPI0028ADD0E4|nr:biotin synthase BioB [Brevundimonas sp.]